MSKVYPETNITLLNKNKCSRRKKLLILGGVL